MSMDDRYIVDTPENISVSYGVAGIGSRFLAGIIDTFLIGLIYFVFSLSLGYIRTTFEDWSSVFVAIILILMFLVFWGYYILFELLWNGQSPGKRAVGLRVVHTGGRPISFVGSAIRNLVRVVDFLPSMYGVGVVSMFVDGRSRRLGDLAAGTLVIKEERVVTLESLTEHHNNAQYLLPLKPGQPLPTLELQQVDQLKMEEFELIHDFLTRRSRLSSSSRARLARQLAGLVYERLQLTPNNYPEAVLEYVATQFRIYQTIQFSQRTPIRSEAPLTSDPHSSENIQHSDL
jgi:uncharacterized RDD family membrane protein YckC